MQYTEKIINWLKILFCNHDWQQDTTNGTETCYHCKKCPKSELRKLSDLY